MAIILNRLRNGRSARPDELAEYVSREMELFDDKHSDVSLRTLLLNFELLSSIDADSVLQKYVIAEHRRPPFRLDISAVLHAIRNCHPIEFDYTLDRNS